MLKDWTDTNGNLISWDQVQAVIFDVDGTLYHQPPVRQGMARKLAWYYLTHPAKARELWGIYHFRRLREEEAFRTVPLSGQVQEAARRAGIKNTERLQQAIRRWMFEEPLVLIAAHGNEPVLALLKELHAGGKQIIIYSDYPPEDKLSALQVTADYLFYPGRGGLTELKPSKKCMREILRTCGISPDRMVFLGDRAEKDGKSAALVNMPFILVGRRKK